MRLWIGNVAAMRPAGLSSALYGSEIGHQRPDLRRSELKMGHFQTLVANHYALAQRFLEIDDRIFERERAEWRRLVVGARAALADSMATATIFLGDCVSERDQRCVGVSRHRAGQSRDGRERHSESEANVLTHLAELTSRCLTLASEPDRRRRRWPGISAMRCLTALIHRNARNFGIVTAFS